MKEKLPLGTSAADAQEIAEIGEVYRAQMRAGRELGRDLTDKEAALIALSLRECFKARALNSGTSTGTPQHG